MRLRFVHGLVAGLALGALAVVVTDRLLSTEPVGAAVVAGDPVPLEPGETRVVSVEAGPRGLAAYAGQGAWVDVFDYAPAYQDDGVPSITPDDLDEMADRGVTTLFLQAARRDDRAPEGLVSPWLLARFLARAHDHGMRVVGWYLPTLAEVDADLDRLVGISEFEAFGHRFDGVAVDIEDNATVADPGQRSAQLVELSGRLRGTVGDDALGAIIVPPVLTEVINEQFWPSFPYADLAGVYDVWLPMSYWTFRTEASGYRDGHAYNDESVRRLRDNLGDDDAPVHSIGGVGDLATADELADFARSLSDTGSIGGSVYDWDTLSGDGRALLQESFESGAASSLPSPP